uniref:Uncharacterized protein n=1 Tax=Octopus bimaculoides TaxID=37653 RepID=A0A0L8HMX9_OCTBM
MKDEQRTEYRQKSRERNRVREENMVEEQLLNLINIGCRACPRRCGVPMTLQSE